MSPLEGRVGGVKSTWKIPAGYEGVNMQRRLTAGGIPPQSVTWEIRVIASPYRKGQKGEERLFQETPVANKSDSVLSSSSKAALESAEKAALVQP